MRDLEHARLMLAMAGKDFRALQGMNDPEVFDDEIYGFHVQQAAEKSLKAWLSSLGAEYPKTHDLRLLLQLLKEHGQQVTAFFDLIEYYSYAVQFRYEALPPEDAPLDRKEALECVSRLINHVEDLL
jgi:HEPN domain-containing protein